jgi:hypothetical protein
MKCILSLLVLISPLFCLAQAPYQSIVEGRTAYYQGEQNYFSDSGRVYAVRIDSAENITGGRILHQYRQLNNNELYCLGSSWIGSEILIYDDGLNVFVSQNSFTGSVDTFQLQTTLSPGDSDLFHRFSNGSYLEVTCESLDYEQVLTTFDSVKTFSLQLKDAAGNDTTSVWNQKEIKLSKNKGLVQFYNLLNVFSAYQGESIKLTGFTNPPEGYKPPTASDIFDFDIGDEFQTANTQPFWLGSWHNEYEKKIIINKNVSMNGDTIMYTMSCYTVTVSWSNFQYQGATELYDTISITYTLADAFPIDSLPFSVQHNTFNIYLFDFYFNWGYNQIFRSAFCQKDVISLPAYFVGLDSPLYCLDDALCFGGCWVYKFAPGLGIIAKYSADYPNEYGYTLQYYRKGNDSCGTPINFQQWLGEENISSSATTINVYPNPSDRQLFIRFEQPVYQVELMNELGIRIRNFSRQEIPQQQLEINVHDLPSGTYFVRIHSSDGIVVKTVVFR